VAPPALIIKPDPSADAVAVPPVLSADGQHLALVGASVNAGLAAVKILTGVFGHSYALIADGMESGLDVASSLVIWGGLRYATKSPDADHPYGHGKAEPISALLVSSVLTGAALVLAGLSVREILSPHRALPAWITLAVLVVVIVVKEALFRRVHAVGKRIASSAVRTDAWHHRADAITSISAFIGILIARVGGPACASADAWAALFACGIIGFNGYRLMLPAIAEIMDSAPDPEIAQRVRDAAAAVTGVATVEKCRVRKMGLDFYVDLHVGVDGLLTVAAGHQIAHEVKDAVRVAERRVADVLVHVEPENMCPYPGRGPRQ
jgi:cation diffusion facilitator family transporter